MQEARVIHLDAQEFAEVRPGIFGATVGTPDSANVGASGVETLYVFTSRSKRVDA